MKTFKHLLQVLILMIFISSVSRAQVPTSYEFSLRNDVQVSPTVYQFDIYLQNKDLTNIFELDLYQAGILVNPSIANGGTITASVVAGSSQLVTSQQPTTGIAFASNCIKLANPGLVSHGGGTIIPTTSPGVRIATIRITNTVPFGQFSPNLTFNFTASPYNTAVYAFDQTSPYLSTPMTNPAYFTTSNLTNRVLNGPAIPLTITGVTANNKVYDGTTTATLNTGSAVLVGVQGTDVVTLVSTGATGTFADKNIGTAKIVTTSGFTLGGANAWSYTLTQPTTTANITAASLSVSGVTANNKVYDGTIAATLNTGSAALSGIMASDVVNLSTSGATGAFANKTVGTAKAVSTSGFTISGADAGNYTLTQPSLTANITAVNLTISGVTANNKTYNGTTAATLNTASAAFVGVILPDVVTLNSANAVGTFSDKNVGTAKTVTTSGFIISGADAQNYTLTQPTTTANITPSALLTITGISASNKVYNGTTAATINTASAVLVGVIQPDVVTLNTTGVTGTFADKNVGTAKVVTTAGFTLSGANAGNYTLTQPSLTANITAASLTVTGVTANNKVYDGTTAATLNTGSASLSGVIGADVVTLVSTGATGTFVNKSVGTAKVVSTSGFSLSGADAGNYILVQPATTANITAVGLTITGVSANNKVYNGTTAATLNKANATLVGILGADVVTLVSSGATGTFADKNIGTAKAVTIAGFTLSGTDAGNYTLTQPSSTANITAASLTILGVTANNKVYDGTVAVILNTGNAKLVGVFGTDVVTLSSSGATGIFANKNIGTAKAVTITGFTISGTDAGNYTLTQPSSTANITAAGLTVTGATANNKVYDGTTSVTLNTGSAVLSGVIGADVVTLVSSNITGAFVNKNVGTAKVVSTSGFTLSGADAGNYTLTQPLLTANITAADLTVTGATANNKVYDGTTVATLNVSGAALVGVLGTDIVTLGSSGVTGAFVNKNVGTAKAVSTTGFTISGTDAGNYTLTQPSLTANITAASLLVSSATANNKVYDGTTAATLNTGSAALSGVKGKDVVTLVSSAATGTFVNKNVGKAKAVSTSDFTLSGTDAGNYTVTQPSLTANITAAGLTISGATANNKVYDGTTAATLNTGSAVLTGVMGTDVVTLNSSGATGTFADKNAGTAKTVSTAGFTISGADAGDYTIMQPSLTADITAKALTITANDLSKCFGMTWTFTGKEFMAMGLVTGDTVMSVSLISAGAADTALAATYNIIPSMAVGTGLTNYTITYVNGVLTVKANPTPVITLSSMDTISSSASTGNQWYTSTGIIQGATGQTYVATQDGMYWTIVTTNGCTSANSDTIIVVLTGINEITVNSKINIYPVPNNGQFKVNFNTLTEKHFDILIHNAIGSMVFEEKNVIVKGNLEHNIDFAPATAGTYFVTLKSDDQQVIKRIIILK